jgi:hypothetical protein
MPGKKQSDLNKIHCDVKNCHYHDKADNCMASKIDVGPNFACSSSDTVCSTFKEKQNTSQY